MGKLEKIRKKHPPSDIRLMLVEDFGIKRMRELIKIAYIGLWKDRFNAVVALSQVDHTESRKCILHLAKWDIAKEVRRVAFEYANALGIKDCGKPLVLRPMLTVEQIIDVPTFLEHLSYARSQMGGYMGAITFSSLFHRYSKNCREYDIINGLIPNENDMKDYIRSLCDVNKVFDLSELNRSEQ